jgi:hypothetical protein
LALARRYSESVVTVPVVDHSAVAVRGRYPPVPAWKVRADSSRGNTALNTIERDLLESETATLPLGLAILVDLKDRQASIGCF